MPTLPANGGANGGRSRVAIASPEILAHIRREFTRKGLEVQIEGLPTKLGARSWVEAVLIWQRDQQPRT